VTDFYDTTGTPYLRPAIPITLSLITGILMGAKLPGFVFVALTVFIAIVISLAVCLQRERPSRWSPLLAAGAAGYLAMVPWASPHYGPDHVTRFMDGGYWRIQATVIDEPIDRLGRTRFVAEVYRLSREGVSHRVKGKIRVTVVGRAALSPGDRVAFPARIRSFRNFRNPGGFDYRRYMAFRGIHGSAWVGAEKLNLGDSRPPGRTGRLMPEARRRLGRIIDAAGSDDEADEKAVLKALVFGDRSGVDDELRRRFNRSGVGHLLAISGLHVGIVATVAFAFFRWLFSFFPPLLWRGWGRPLAAAITMVPVLAYGLLSGMSPSTQRAEVMVMVFLAALILGRSRELLNTLAVAALVILVCFPPALFSISFQLSFAAVATIVYGLEKIAWVRPPAPRLAGKTAGWLLGFVLVSVLAVFGTAPVALFHFNQISLAGVAANLLLVPLVGFVVVPLGLVAASVGLLFAPLALPVFRLGIEILHLALMIVDGFAALPFAAIKTVTPSLIEIALYYLAGWSLLKLRKTPLASWVLVFVLVVAVGDGLYWSYERFWHRDLEVTAIDVGQGAACILELPGGHVILLDGGGFSDNRFFDMGERVVAPLLWRKKIATVDTLILTHPNADHLNGLIFIARHFNVRELWINGDVNTSRGYAELIKACREQSVAVREVDAGTDGTTIGGVELSILNPPPGVLGRPGEISQEDRNNASMVVKASFGSTAFLFTGDIMQRAEHNLVKRAGGRLASTVLFAPHHGSRTSNSRELIDTVGPEVVVISAGAGNRFGFPHAEVTDRYRDAGCRLLCTCTHGAVILSSDGEEIHIAHQSAPPGTYP
jgi:competence protein ComEC